MSFIEFSLVNSISFVSVKDNQLHNKKPFFLNILFKELQLQEVVIKTKIKCVKIQSENLLNSPLKHLFTIFLRMNKTSFLKWAYKMREILFFVVKVQTLAETFKLLQVIFSKVLLIFLKVLVCSRIQKN